MISPRALVKGNPARAKFAAENFRKLQAPHSALVCGTMCGMHVFAGFVDKFFGHFRPEIRYGTLPRGSQNFYKMLVLPFDTKFSTRHVVFDSSGEIPDSKITHQHTHSPD